MGIVNLQRVAVGQVGDLPGNVTLTTTDNLATLTTAGYLNNRYNSVQFANNDIVYALYSYNKANQTGTFGIFTVSVATTNIVTLSAWTDTNVVTPTTANHIAVYTNSLGQISQDKNPAINAGSIQAGVSGTAGGLISFPATASTGSLKLQSAINGGNYANILTNAGTGQQTTWSMPDPGNATTNLVLNNVGLQNTFSVTLNQTQVNGMSATPVQLIGAIANNAIFVLGATLNYIGGTNAFASGGVIVIQYGNTATGAGTSATSGASVAGAGFLTGGTTNQFATVLGYNNSATGTGTASSGIINTGIFISNKTGAFTNAGTGASLVITLSYVVVPMS